MNFDLNIDDVRAFVAAVDGGSVAKAALRLNLTQPAVSRRIQRLEDTLGITLLDRDSKPARPTRAGEAAYKRCLAVLRASEALTRETRAAVAAGPLRLGVTMAMSDSVLVPALEALRQTHQDIAVRLCADRSPELRRQVGIGQLDAAVVAGRRDRPIDDPRAQLLGTERVLIVASRELGLRARRLADLGEQSWVINPDGCGFRIQLERALAAAGHVLDVTAETYGTALQLALIARGAGLGLVPERLLQESPLRDRVHVIEVEDFEASLSIWLVRSGLAGPFESAVDVFAGTVSGLLGNADATATGVAQ